ncbi:hypothetical protein EYF80_064172 [Liparis tanakae]|uniref:Uncharacterized protein n=1 Tax=Liparis tanakae TaxID=230148 RepID=A0A4Z2E9Z5_9TELE|nr:hypothetical protein EYF80_064172 [Liparis tanakae]
MYQEITGASSPHCHAAHAEASVSCVFCVFLLLLQYRTRPTPWRRTLPRTTRCRSPAPVRRVGPDPRCRGTLVSRTDAHRLLSPVQNAFYRFYKCKYFRKNI